MNLQVKQKTESFEIFNDDRSLIQKWLIEVIEAEYRNSIMQEMILPFFANPRGKKLRPLIVLNTFKMIYGEELNGMEDKVKFLCCAFEISHNASLMIDDVFDKDIVRRGEDAFHVEFGTFAALSAGYNLSAFVFDLATRTENHEIVREVGKVGSALSSALFMSKDQISKNRITEEFFMDLLYRKTSALFESSSKTGALLASNDENHFENANMFGQCFGTAYQLRDDVLGIVASFEDMGKPIQSDITNRFQSLITIEAMKLGNPDQVKILDQFYLKRTSYSEDEIRQILIDTGAVAKVAKKAIGLVKLGHEYLDKFAPSFSQKKLRTLISMINFDAYEELIF